MTVSSLVVLAISFLIALVASWTLVLPFFQRADLRGISEQDQLREDARENKERVLQSLEDLEQEFLAEKISEAEYRQTKLELTQEAMRCLAVFDRLTGQESPSEPTERPRRATA